MLRSNKVRFSVIAMAAVLILGIVGAAVAVAGGFGGFKEAKTVAGLQSARGIVFDRVVTEGPASGQLRNWMISGEWTLDCHKKKACADSPTNQIEFDIAFAMFLDSDDGTDFPPSSHGHQFSNFSATSATVSGEGKILTILGTIDGSGPLGGPVTITLKRHSSGPQHFTFSFDLTDHHLTTNIIKTAIDGVVVESKGK